MRREGCVGLLATAIALLALSGCCPSTAPTRENALVQRPAPAPVPSADTCRIRRAAFDIGSATTKVKVADIDLCKQRIVRVLMAEDAAVFYRDDVIGKPAGQAALRDETMARGLEVLNDFKTRAEALEPAGFAAVATSALRRASNGSAFIERIRRETGILARVISQGEEAELGFLGSIASLGVDPERALVWDVGGQSMQMTITEPDGGLRIYQGQLASGQMRDYVLHELQGRRGDALSPNPITPETADAARAHAAEFAAREIPDDIKARLASPQTIVVGIGALKYYGDPDPKRATTCTVEGLEQTLTSLIGRSDEQIGGPYAKTQVSDRLLIVGFMQALGITRMTLANIDLSDGLLFHSDYWSADFRLPKSTAP